MERGGGRRPLSGASGLTVGFRRCPEARYEGAQGPCLWVMEGQRFCPEAGRGLGGGGRGEPRSLETSLAFAVGRDLPGEVLPVPLSPGPSPSRRALAGPRLRAPEFRDFICLRSRLCPPSRRGRWKPGDAALIPRPSLCRAGSPSSFPPPAPVEAGAGPRAGRAGRKQVKLAVAPPPAGDLAFPSQPPAPSPGPWASLGFAQGDLEGTLGHLSDLISPSNAPESPSLDPELSAAFSIPCLSFLGDARTSSAFEPGLDLVRELRGRGLVPVPILRMRRQARKGPATPPGSV